MFSAEQMRQMRRSYHVLTPKERLGLNPHDLLNQKVDVNLSQRSAAA